MLAAGCSTSGRVMTQALLQQSGRVAVELTGTPFYPQTTDQCGPAALATALNVSGIDVTPDDVAPALYIPERAGSLQVEMMAATRSHGRVPHRVPPDLVSLFDELHAGRPVVVMQNLRTRSLPIWHFAVVIGYLPESNQFILRSGDVQRHLVSTAKFMKTWQLAGSWAVVVLPPDQLPRNVEMDAYVRSIADMETTGQIEAAAIGYHTAVTEWPNNPIALLGFANVQYELGDLTAAEQAYLAMIEKEPANVIALNNLAIVLAERGQRDKAIQTVDEALSLLRPMDSLHGVVSQTRAEILDGAYDRHYSSD